MAISQIRNVTVFVEDQDRAKEFYTGVLGFGVRADFSGGGNRWLEVGPVDGGAVIVLMTPFPGKAAGSSSGVILECSDLDADVAAIRGAGGELEGPQTMPWGRQAIVNDPDGNSFVLAEPR